MKKTNTAIKIVGLLFFLALLSYLIVYIIGALDKPLSTAMAVSYTVRDSADISGIVVRDEEVIYSVYNTVYISAQEGKRVSRGGELAQAFDSTEDLQRAVRINELKNEISQLEALYSSDTAASDIIRRDAIITNDILKLKSALYAGNFAEVEDISLQLKTLTFTGAKSVSEIKAQLDELKAELNGLLNLAEQRSAAIYATRSGLFSTAVDGWETLSTASLQNLRASELARLLKEDRDKPDNVLGKLVYGMKWYYIALVDKDDGALLDIGSTANLLFGKYYNQRLKMKVESISHIENGMCSVVFSCDTAMMDILTMRKQEAELVFEEFTGLRVPRKSIHVDEDGNACVYVQTALQAERKRVKVEYDFKDFYVVSSTELHVGDQIIVSGKNLYNGRVLN